ncbi:hypothetical protein BCR41DRAFT_370444 [Lobosporangium transversale]|uniref:C2H2-type domain-containing protein n=1 Tax=Lobosporangium transversale TaxID=64571 RepID=A0A1Y2GNG1_9FUNG|nr:hypothetical protein BCR41DRAFT_370444 [Lobosporangium transversale]ORZ16650.1 hypothetical protein BCR41DRAFT_370444 [Lobosporangium transversale]|eukprot:XP_021881585.1 hypothetical protein BCR41DRAFT_370444 [Lobosporangium transversale]
MPSTASLSTLPTSSYSHSFYDHTQPSARPSSQPHSSTFPSSQMDFSEADSALHQQSKRLAGLSITNATGAKVSILNDNSAEINTPSEQQPVPHSPFSPSLRSQETASRQRHTSNERPHPMQRFQSYPGHRQEETHDQDHSESSYTGRSSSLTNASTPIYSSGELTSSKSSSKPLAISSQRSRSLSSGSTLSPRISAASSSPSASVSSPTHPFFSRSYSEENQSDDSESNRKPSDPNSTNASGSPVAAKRKYMCSHPGCHKCFTTSGHLARHNRIHTGERNFPCLMPGCPSKFSRQDNMMQHYRTHISPKSRRCPIKKEILTVGVSGNSSQENLVHTGREHSPVIGYHGADYDQHHHVSKMNGSRQGSRQNSPPRFNPLDRNNGIEFNGRNHMDVNYNVGSGTVGLRHKKSGVIQAYQHHTPMPHFDVHAVSSMSQSQNEGHGQAAGHPIATSQGAMPSPLTPTMSATFVNHSQHQAAYTPAAPYPLATRHQDMHTSYNHSHDIDISKPALKYHRSDVLASPRSPMTQDVERMEGVTPSLEDRNRHYYHQAYYSQQPHPEQSYHQHHSNSSHAGHAQAAQPHDDYQHNSSAHAHERLTHENRYLSNRLNAAMPPSPQSTPHTPTKYRFDPIQDCLQQDRHQYREHRESHYEPQPRLTSQYQGTSMEDEDMSSTTRLSIMSSASSMTSTSSASSVSLPAKAHNADKQRNQETEEEMSGLAHLAQIVTTYG